MYTSLKAWQVRLTIVCLSASEIEFCELLGQYLACQMGRVDDAMTYGSTALSDLKTITAPSVFHTMPERRNSMTHHLPLGQPPTLQPVPSLLHPVAAQNFPAVTKPNQHHHPRAQPVLRTYMSLEPPMYLPDLKLGAMTQVHFYHSP